jgi:excisionase family DNA binding protein
VPTIHEQLMSTEDLSAFLGVPVKTIYQWRTRGDGPRGYRVGKHVRYRREDVEQWLERQADPRPAA